MTSKLEGGGVEELFLRLPLFNLCPEIRGLIPLPLIDIGFQGESLSGESITYILQTKICFFFFRGTVYNPRNIRGLIPVPGQAQPPPDKSLFSLSSTEILGNKRRMNFLFQFFIDQATILRAASIEESFLLFQKEKCDVLSGLRPRLLQDRWGNFF